MRFQGSLQQHRGDTSICERLRSAPGTIPVVGLNWERVPWAQQRGDRTIAELELDGRLERDRFTVSAVRRWRPTAVEHEPPLPCPEPAPHARVLDPSRVSPEHSRAAVEYAESQPDFVAVWAHWMIPEALRQQPGKNQFEAEDGVLAFKFSDRLETHRAEIQKRYGGAVCVARGSIQRSVQEAISRRAALLLQREGTRHGRLDCSFSLVFDGRRERLEVGALAWDPARLGTWLSRELSGVPVDVRSALTPL